jgi:hypothetical protein
MAYTTIDKPTDYFETTTYAGGTTAITSLDFSPDWVWAKKRDGTESHGLFDSVRGATKDLRSDSTNAESTRSGSLTSFDSNGWSMGGSDGIISASGSTYVAWAWRGSDSSASSNTDGDISSTVSANTTSGFSIVNFTKTDGELTVGHGLNAKPSLIIFKPLASANWIVTPEINGSMSNNYLLLHNTDVLGTDGAFSNPTTSVFSISNNIAPNSEHIAYCFANKKGFSKIGSYTGNGSTDGTFVYTGFKPAWTMIKRTTDATEAWIVQDNKRSPFNPSDVFLAPSSSDADATTTNAHIDYLSNGFKLRHNDTRGNTSGKNYLYMAFAESPLATSTGIPTTAR